MNNWNKFFWVFFIVLGGGIIVYSLGNFSLEVLIGLVIIAIGIEKLGEEFSDKKISREQEKMKKLLNYISQWTQKEYEFIRKFRNVCSEFGSAICS